MRYIKVLALVLFFIFSMIFFVQNTEVLSTSLQLKYNLFKWSWVSLPLPYYVLLLFAFGIGAILSMFYFIFEKIRQNRELRKYRNKLKDLEQEVNSLRNLPLEEQNYPGEASTGFEQTRERED